MTKLSENSPRKNRMILVGVTVLIIMFLLSMGLLLAPTEGGSQSKIDSFQACADAGYPIQESFPERCVTPDGKSFTKEN